MKTVRKVLIVGGSGLLGRALVKSLHSAGYEVKFTSRHLHSKSSNVVRWAGKELTAELQAAIEWADVVVNLTGEGIFGKRWTNKYKKELLESRVNTTKLVVEAIAKSESKPEALLNASAVGFYGATSSAVDENTPRGGDFLATLCEQWEQAALSAASFTRVVNLRSGIVLTTQGGFLKQLLPLFKLGLGGRFGDGRQWLSWIHIDDWVAAVKAIIANANFSGPVNITSPFPVSNKHFSAVMGNTLQKPAFLRYPKFLFQLALGEAASALLVSQQVLPSKLLKAGYRFKFPQLAAALNDLVI